MRVVPAPGSMALVDDRWQSSFCVCPAPNWCPISCAHTFKKRGWVIPVALARVTPLALFTLQSVFSPATPLLPPLFPRTCPRSKFGLPMTASRLLIFSANMDIELLLVYGSVAPL